MVMDKLHLYLRVSSDGQEQKGESLEFQRKLGIKKSKELGLDYHIWDEGGLTSNVDSIESRPVLMELLNEMRSGKIKYLWCFETSRLMRTDMVKVIIQKELIQNDVTLYVRDVRWDLDDPTMRFMFDVMGSVNKLENSLKSERSRQGKLSKMKKGGWKGGSLTFGYKLIDKIVHIDEVEGEWVKKIFDWYKGGKSLRYIKGELDRNGIQPKYGKGMKTWSLGSIRMMLGNKSYNGVLEYRDRRGSKFEKLYEFKFPKIVDDKTFNSVQSKFTKYSKSYKNQFNSTQHFYLLRDKMECMCGNSMKGKIVKTKGNERYWYYCNIRTKKWLKNEIGKEDHYKRGVFCRNTKSMNIKIVDRLVFNTVIDVITQSCWIKEEFKKELVGNVVRDRNLDSDSKRSISLEINRVKKKIEDCREKLNDIDSSIVLNNGKYIVNDIVVQDVRGVRDRILNEKENLEVRFKELHDKVDDSKDGLKWLNWIEKFNLKYDDSKLYKDKEKKEIVDNFVEKIIVSYDEKKMKHSLDIRFRLPIVGDRRERVGVNKFKIVDGEDLLSLKDMVLYGRDSVNKKNEWLGNKKVG